MPENKHDSKSAQVLPSWLYNALDAIDLNPNAVDEKVYKVKRWLEDETPIDDLYNISSSILPSIVYAATASRNPYSSLKLMDAIDYGTEQGINFNGISGGLSRLRKHYEIPDAVAPQLQDIHKNPERFFLLNRNIQDKELKKAGYIPQFDSDYGLVRRAVGNRNYPIYQTLSSAIGRDSLTPIGNLHNNIWYGPEDAALQHANSFPSTIYVDNKGNFYQAAWDLNDYGGTGGSTSSKLGDVLDKIGNPIVFRTGYQPIVSKKVSSYKTGWEPSNINLVTKDKSADEVYWNDIERLLEKVPNYNQIMREKYGLLPEVVVTPKKRSIKYTRGK